MDSSPPKKEYTFKLTVQDLTVIDSVLQNLPYKVAVPIINKINTQIAEQEKGP